MTAPLSPLERYHTDPVFHALVHVLSDGGYADADGVAHDGPTVADVRKVQRIYDALESINMQIVPTRSLTERQRQLCWTVLNRAQWQPLIDDGLITPEELSDLQAKLTE